MESLLALDGNILLFIQNNIRNPVLTPVMKAVTHLGDKGIFWVLLTLILLLPKKTRRAALCSMFALICSVVINNLILKNLAARVRPYDMISALQPIVARPDDWSFPSGHSAASFASAVAFAKTLPEKYRRWGIVLLVLAAVIALSRLYVGVHYPTDVLAGTVSGIICGFIGAWLGRLLQGRMPSRFLSSQDD